jgi:flagellar hook-associated protein 3 FlgL
MYRVSTNMPNDNMQHYMKIRQWKMNQMQNKMGSQKKIHNLRDNPVAAAHSVRYESNINRLNQFSSNVETLISDGRIAEGYVQEAVNILQRVREITVAGANGTYTDEDTAYMAEEVNQLLNELVEIGNAQSGDGTAVFAGDRDKSRPFRAVFGHIAGKGEEVITSVEYGGSIAPREVEISERSFIKSNFPGIEVFWAEPMHVIADADAAGYMVQEDAAVSIDGYTVQFRAGDNIQAIISKINESGAGVKAKLDPVKNSLVLQTTSPHQLWIEDIGEGTVMRDLGILSGSSDLPPHNFARDAMVSGGSLYDQVMYVRDRLYEGDSYDLGGSGLKGIDNALNNLLASLADLGARDERLQTVGKRLSYETTEMVSRNAKEIDLDMAEAITDLKMLEYTHKAALQTAGRILQPTLLDFLR